MARSLARDYVGFMTATADRLAHLIAEIADTQATLRRLTAEYRKLEQAVCEEPHGPEQLPLIDLHPTSKAVH